MKPTDSFDPPFVTAYISGPCEGQIHILPAGATTSIRLSVAEAENLQLALAYRLTQIRTAREHRANGTVRRGRVLMMKA